VLIDGSGTLTAGTTNPAGVIRDARAIIIERAKAVDITLDDLILTASTLPAIMADRVTLLQIENNRVAMENVRSEWPAVWVNGKEIRIVRNWLGIQSQAVNRTWLPVTVDTDLVPANALSGASSSVVPTGAVPLNPGGIQIAGPSVDVFVLDNEIDAAGRNGITLGSVTVIGPDGKPTGEVTGVTVEVPGPCDTPITLTIPGSTTGGQGGGGKIVAAGSLINIDIARNRIRKTGLCGIGPVGFFDLVQAVEVISIENLTIASNTIESTLLGDLAQPADNSAFGYGAICVPSVENLVIRDNSITDFGKEPGDPGCGIFVLHGEMVEISRNHILETRDWARASRTPADGIRGGIVFLLVTPPTFKAQNAFTNASLEAVGTVTPVFLPNLPALRVEHNTVRVALGRALLAAGFGPFSIVNNHLATGGTVEAEGRTFGATVLIGNMSLSVESQTLAGKFSQLDKGNFTFNSNLAQGGAMPSCGAVVFTNNICQFEARLSGQRCSASVIILALDDLIFGHNECWLDGRPLTGIFDALLAAGSLQVTSNRFQEAAGFAVVASGFTVGALNITSHNIATYCLFATGTLQPAIFNNNLTLMPSQLCQQQARELKLNFTT